MNTKQDEQAIRKLIERWAAAVRTQDIDGVLSDHADDIVMFDVPPPNDRVRGIAAYRDSWPAFFEHQGDHGIFDIVTLDVTVGDGVAFAHALLRCGTEAELTADPDNRLRLTVGLEEREEHWVVMHEHHSYPLRADSDCAG